MSQLFCEAPLLAYQQGASVELVVRRNANLGQLLLSDNAIRYIQLLYRLLLFRREHELEPLYEEIRDEVQEVQELVSGEPYAPERFNDDLQQLVKWQLISERIERERLRGYRDSRKRKFRYKLEEETLAFLEWLEERLQEDYETTGEDTRDLLEEVRDALAGLRRLLHQYETARAHEDDARRIARQLVRAEELTLRVTRHLGEIHAGLLTFLARPYNHEETRQILGEVRQFVNRYLKQIYALRGEMVPLLEDVGQPRMLEKLGRCVAALAEDRRQAQHLLKPRDERLLTGIPARLLADYQENGKLDRLCRRINEDALGVLRKLNVYLQELERKNHRLEDLRSRIAELAAWPEHLAPHAFLTEVIAPADFYDDPRRGTAERPVQPPEPRWDERTTMALPPAYLRKKHTLEGPLRSMEQARLARLREWIRACLIDPQTSGPWPLSAGRFATFADLARVLELARAGLLGSGQQLAEIAYALAQEPEHAITLTVQQQSLTCGELWLRERGPHER